MGFGSILWQILDFRAKQWIKDIVKWCHWARTTNIGLLCPKVRNNIGGDIAIDVPPTKILEGMCPRHPRRRWRQCVWVSVCQKSFLTSSSPCCCCCLCRSICVWCVSYVQWDLNSSAASSTGLMSQWVAVSWWQRWEKDCWTYWRDIAITDSTSPTHTDQYTHRHRQTDRQTDHPASRSLLTHTVCEYWLFTMSVSHV